MRAIRLPNGNLLIPVEPDESDANDCMAEITSDDPEYGTWPTHAVDGEDPRRKRAGKRAVKSSLGREEQADELHEI